MQLIIMRDYYLFGPSNHVNFDSHLGAEKKRKEMAHMNQESEKYDNTGNLYTVSYSEPDTNSHSIRVSSHSKSSRNDYCASN
jgi:hypothetical protein